VEQIVKLNTIFLTVMLMLANEMVGVTPTGNILSGNHIIMNITK